MKKERIAHKILVQILKEKRRLARLTRRWEFHTKEIELFGVEWGFVWLRIGTSDCCGHGIGHLGP